jgi:hypothetical protein
MLKAKGAALKEASEAKAAGQPFDMKAIMAQFGGGRPVAAGAPGANPLGGLLGGLLSGGAAPAGNPGAAGARGAAPQAKGSAPPVKGATPAKSAAPAKGAKVRKMRSGCSAINLSTVVYLLSCFLFLPRRIIGCLCLWSDTQQDANNGKDAKGKDTKGKDAKGKDTKGKDAKVDHLHMHH